MVTFVEVLFVMAMPAPALRVYLLAVMEVRPDTDEILFHLALFAVITADNAVRALYVDRSRSADPLIDDTWEEPPAVDVTLPQLEDWAEMEEMGTIPETVFHTELCELMEDFGTIADTVFHTALCELMELFGTYPVRDWCAVKNPDGFPVYGYHVLDALFFK